MTNDDNSHKAQLLEDLARGQRILTGCILLFIAGFLILLFGAGSARPDSDLPGIVFVAALWISVLGTLVGSYFLTSGWGHPIIRGLITLLLLPVLNILFVLILMARAGRVRRKAGLKSTFLGGTVVERT